MGPRLRRARLLAAVGTAVLCAVAPPAAQARRPHARALVRQAVSFGISRPLRDARPARLVTASGRALLGAMPPAGVDVQGQREYGYHPSDANGAAGPNDYVQIVNTSVAVYDKLGNLRDGFPKSIAALWQSGTPDSGTCGISTVGDPIVLYDHLANRWLVSQMGYTNAGGTPVGPFYECVAVSQTGDPTGSYYHWAFLESRTAAGDYPKLGVWPGAYTLTVNQFAEPSGTFSGAGVAALDRAALLRGDPGARMLYLDTQTQTHDTSLWTLLPADWDGATPPPLDAPVPLLQLGTTASQLEMWQLAIDWNGPGLTLSHVVDLPVAPFTPAGRIAQPGTAQGLDPLSQVLMYRLQYRNFGSYQTLVVNHSVDDGTGTSGNSPSAIRWYEIRKTGSGQWTLNQQGTYAPQDGVSRWMGSIAMDRAGDMALGYSVSGLSTYPGVRYVGRLASDPPGTLPQAEATAVTGSHSQDNHSRWGDYSSISLDPGDDCTFWYTQQYVDPVLFPAWTTQIVSFAFPGCIASSAVAPVNVVPPTISGTADVGQTLSAADGTWTGATKGSSPMDVAYQWQRCSSGACRDIPGANASTYLVAAADDKEATLRVVVTRTNEIGSAAAVSAETPAVPTAPANTVPPAISGTATEGQRLTASTGTWTGPPLSYGYAWSRCDASGAACVPIAGATSATYVLVADDVGHTLTVTVTATNGLGSASATSAASPLVIAVPSSGGGGGGGGGGSSGGSGGSGGGGGSGVADLRLEGSVEPAQATVGETITWWITVNDYNTGPAAGLWVDIQLPASVSLVSSYADRGTGCTVVADNKLHCYLDWLADNVQFGHVILVTKITATGDHMLTAVTGYSAADPTPADNTLTLTATTPLPPVTPAPTVTPTIKIVKATAAKTGIITVTVAIKAWAVNAKQVKDVGSAAGYWVIYVDGKRSAISRQPGRGVTTKLAPGTHRVQVELVREGGKNLQPRARSAVVVVHVPAPKPTKKAGHKP